MPLHGDEKRSYERGRSRQKSADVAEIGQPPERNEKLWKRYKLNLHRFLAERFPHSTGRSPFSADHKLIIARTQEDILEGGQDLFQMFRGGAKSSITEGAAIWATGYGHRRFFCPIGATDEAAQQSLDSIQMELETNDLLMEIFPAICHAARALEGVPQRARKQSMGGVRTMIEWTTDRCVLPTYKGFDGSGSIIWPRSITARGLRGMRFKRADGTYQRPDFVMVDDPQTDDSAASPTQCAKLEKKIKRTILRLAGHEEAIACIVNATPIEPDDLIERLAKDRAWRTAKVPILKSLSAAHDSHWLGPYADIRTNYAEGDDNSKAKAHKAANTFYRANRKIMDAGAVATWSTCFAKNNELSAIQHAYNILLDIGEEAFAAECLLSPLRERTGLQRLTVDEICRKTSGFKRGIVPPQCTLLTKMTDVHPSILYWMVWAWEPNFTGYLIDYGTFPDQGRKYFTHAGHPVRLQKLFPKRDDDARVLAGLNAHLQGDELHQGIMRREWIRTDKLPMRVGQGSIDANGQAKKAVMLAINASPFKAALYPSFGKGVKCSQPRMSVWAQARKHPSAGPEWFPTKGGAGEPRGVMHDTNYWGARFHRALALPPGSQGALYLFDAPPNDHKMVGEHWLAQPIREVTIESRTVYEFQDPKAGADNHFYDTAIGAMVAASRGGITNLNDSPTRTPRSRQKVKYSNDF